MKGLLLKDAYQLWSYTRWIILASVAMMLMGTFFMKEGSNFFMLYGGLLLGILPMTLLAYDQNGRFSAYSFFRTALYRILDRQGKCRYQDITAIIAVKEQTDFSVWNCRLWWQ